MKVKKSKLFYLYIIAGALLMILSIMLAPIWENAGDWAFFKYWGHRIINFVIGAVVLVYVFSYLLPKLLKLRSNGVIRVLSIIEFIILLLIGIGCILTQFNVLNVNDISKIIGIALYTQGVIELFRAYFYQRNSAMKYSISRLCVAIALVTLGVYFFASSIITNTHVLWIFVSLIFLCSIYLIVYGILAKPASSKSKK